MVPERRSSLRVAVYIEDKPLHSKVAGMLSSIDSCTHRTLDPAAPPGKGAADVIVTASSNSISVRRGDFRVLLLIEDPNRFQQYEILYNSADGYIATSDISVESLRHVLHQFRHSQPAIPMILGDNLVNHAFSGVGFSCRAQLTTRELETLDLIVAGLSNKQIGRKLNISQHGAKRLVSSVLMKLGAANRTAAAVIALQDGLVSRVR